MEPQLVFPTAAPWLISGISLGRMGYMGSVTVLRSQRIIFSRTFGKFFDCIYHSQMAFNPDGSCSANDFACNYPYLWHWNCTYHVVSFSAKKANTYFLQKPAKFKLSSSLRESCNYPNQTSPTYSNLTPRSFPYHPSSFSQIKTML